MISGLPVPRNFREELQAAQSMILPAERLQRFSLLAQQQLGFLETIQLCHALDKLNLDVDHKAVPDFSFLRLAILASSTVDHLVPGIRVAGLRRRLWIDVHVGGYGQYRQDLLEAASPLHAFTPEMVLFSLTAREAIADMPLSATAETVHAAVERYVDDLIFLWRKARETLNATIIQQTFLDTTDLL